jgi:hypothetical protein
VSLTRQGPEMDRGIGLALRIWQAGWLKDGRSGCKKGGFGSMENGWMDGMMNGT